MNKIKAGLELDIAIANVVAWDWRFVWNSERGYRQCISVELSKGNVLKPFLPSEDANDALKAAEIYRLFGQGYVLYQSGDMYEIGQPLFPNPSHYAFSNPVASQPTVPLAICEAILRIGEAGK